MCRVYKRLPICVGETSITIDLNCVTIEFEVFSAIDTFRVTLYKPALQFAAAFKVRMSPFDPVKVRQFGYVPLKLNFFGPQKSNYWIDQLTES